MDDIGEWKGRVVALEVHVKALDRLLEERRREQERALQVAELNNMHWKRHSDEVVREMAERERNFYPRTLGNMAATISIIAAVAAIVALIR